MTLKEYKEKYLRSYREFAMKADIAEAQVVRYANGHGLPSLENAYKIYLATDKKVGLEDWIRDGNDKK